MQFGFVLGVNQTIDAWITEIAFSLNNPKGKKMWQWFLASAGVTHEKYSPSDLLRIKLAYAISTSQTKPRHARITPLRKNKPGRILLWVKFANTNLPSKKLSCTLLKVSKEAKSLAISVALSWIYVK